MRTLLVVIVLLIPVSSHGIDVRSGERIKQTQPGVTTNTQVAVWLRDRLTDNTRITSTGTPTVTLSPTTVQMGLPANQILQLGDFTLGNQGGTFPPNFVYSGGIGIDSGILLGTGRVGNLNGPGETVQESRTHGAEGPNDAVAETHNEYFRATAERRWFTSGDPDLNLERPGGYDAAALNFSIQLKEKGKLQIKLVLASDEYPEWLQQMFDDAFGVFITGPGIPQENRNMVKAIIQTPVVSGEQALAVDTVSVGTPFPAFFQKNQTPTEPFPPDQLGTLYFNHEYDMFTRVLTRESEIVINPGTYTVKVVVQDINDEFVDTTVFLSTDSFKLINGIMQMGDYNGGGSVEQADLDLVLQNWGKPFGQTPASWIVHRPISGIIDQAELDGVLQNWGKVQVFFKADFDRNGVVNSADLTILNQWKNILGSCASVYEGDADLDGDVDECDNQWYRYETGQRPTPPAQTENCTNFTFLPERLLIPPGEVDQYVMLEEEVLEPIADEVVDTTLYPTMQSHEYPKDKAIAELLELSKRYNVEERKLILKSMIDVFGREALPAEALTDAE